MKVYFIQSGPNGPVKIGKANDVDQRLRELQTGNPKELHIRVVLICASSSNALHMEKVFHRRFKRFRMRGEWFSNKVLKMLREDSADEAMDREMERLIANELYKVMI
jgi:predicted GIY-YIG superfamily endonuclease